MLLVQVRRKFSALMKLVLAGTNFKKFEILDFVYGWLTSVGYRKIFRQFLAVQLDNKHVLFNQLPGVLFLSGWQSLMFFYPKPCVNKWVTPMGSKTRWQTNLRQPLLRNEGMYHLKSIPYPHFYLTKQIHLKAPPKASWCRGTSTNRWRQTYSPACFFNVLNIDDI